MQSECIFLHVGPRMVTSGWDVFSPFFSFKQWHICQFPMYYDSLLLRISGAQIKGCMRISKRLKSKERLKKNFFLCKLLKEGDGRGEEGGAEQIEGGREDWAEEWQDRGGRWARRSLSQTRSMKRTNTSTSTNSVLLWEYLKCLHMMVGKYTEVHH